MKKYTILFYIVLILLVSNSCLEKYLDIAPESGLNEEIVFSKYENFLKYFNTVYYGKTVTNKTDNMQCGVAIKFNTSGYTLTWESLTDMSDQGVTGTQNLVKKGTFIDNNLNGFCYVNNYQNILHSMFTVIRTCNTALQKYVMVKDARQEDMDDLLAQAHFLRAFAHFELFKVWGPMPYLTHVIGPYDEWDIPRLTKHENLMRITADLDTAITYYEKAKTMRRDPIAGNVGNLNSPKQTLPNGVAAKAWKARVLLYAASPLNNENGVQDYWIQAAKENWEAIELALQYGYYLLSAADYQKNTFGAPYTNEQLWGWDAGSYTYTSLSSIVNGVFAGRKSGNSGEGPAQGFVDRFETKWGDPLTTQAERDAASILGHFNEQDPYTNRDPRFYLDIVYNTKPIIGFGTAKIYYENVGGKITYSELLDPTYKNITKTGYYQSKLWAGQSVKNQVGIRYTESMIRLGELYLNYAEAANEAYGPNTPAPGATISAVQAINIIRNRIGMSDVLQEFTISKETFRERIKNERIVELCWEGGSYYFDTRRWKDAPKAMTGPMIGVNIEKVPKSAEYPTGYKYTRAPLPSDRQCSWNDKQYYFPFMQQDLDKMKNFDASINRW
jgi:hypothetical protein